MAKIKQTKTELKAQKDALARYRRFLPMLQLKKQQLQMEIVSIRGRIDEIAKSIEDAEASMAPWIGLLSDTSVDIPFALDGVETDSGNIAGVDIPLFKGIRSRTADIDLFATPPWLDDAVAACATLAERRAEIGVLRRQAELIAEELRTTSQRVNLFEKVKIPECREAIRVITIHIGDEQTSAVARGKIAKGRGAKSEPETSNRQPATDHQQPATGNRKPETGKEALP